MGTNQLGFPQQDIEPKYDEGRGFSERVHVFSRGMRFNVRVRKESCVEYYDGGKRCHRKRGAVI